MSAVRPSRLLLFSATTRQMHDGAHRDEGYANDGFIALAEDRDQRELYQSVSLVLIIKSQARTMLRRSLRLELDLDFLARGDRSWGGFRGD
jgi:hypothetical protein